MIQENRWRRTRNGKNKFSADVCDGCYIISLAGELPASLPTARHTRHSLYRAQFAARALKPGAGKTERQGVARVPGNPDGIKPLGNTRASPGQHIRGDAQVDARARKHAQVPARPERLPSRSCG